MSETEEDQMSDDDSGISWDEAVTAATENMIGVGCWFIGSPEEESTREFLLDEYAAPGFVEAVLAKMRELRDPRWDDVPSTTEHLRVFLAERKQP